jgi:hypothetical protein
MIIISFVLELNNRITDATGGVGPPSLDGANEAAIDELAESFAHSLDNQRHTAYYATCGDRLVTTTSRAPANRAKIVGDVCVYVRACFVDVVVE